MHSWCIVKSLLSKNCFNAPVEVLHKALNYPDEALCTAEQDNFDGMAIAARILLQGLEEDTQQFKYCHNHASECNRAEGKRACTPK